MSRGCQHRFAGVGTVRAGMEFALWASRLRRFPSVAEVIAEFEVHPATANRWLNDYADAIGVLRPTQPGGKPHRPVNSTSTPRERA